MSYDSSDDKQTESIPSDELAQNISVEDALFPYNRQSSFVFNESDYNDISNNDVLNISHSSHLTETDAQIKLEKREKDLHLAAQLGKTLLEKNEELTNEKAQLIEEFTSKIDELEQEKHTINRKLDVKTKETKAIQSQHEQDVTNLQEELDNTKSILKSVEKERNRIAIDLNDQNHKLRIQLQKASDAEQQLAVQVKQLTKQYMEKFRNDKTKIEQLELKEEQISDTDKESKSLKKECKQLRNLNSNLQFELTSAQERLQDVENQLEQKNEKLAQRIGENEEHQLIISQLHNKIENLEEEVLSVQYSNNSLGNSMNSTNNLMSSINSSSLFNELEESFRHNNQDQRSDVSDDITADDSDVTIDKRQSREDKITMLEVFHKLNSSVSSCYLQISQFKQEMFDSYQKIQTINTKLRSHLAINTTDDVIIRSDDVTNDNGENPNLPLAISKLSSLVNDVINVKEWKETSKEIVRKMREKQNQLVIERDEAINEHNKMQVKLAQAKTDLMSANSQLLEAIQQKVTQQEELEAWQDDMEQLIQQTVERGKVPNKRIIKQGQENTTSNGLMSYFRRSSTNNTPVKKSPPQSDVTSLTSKSSNDDVTTDNTSQSGFSSWFRRSTRRKPQPTPQNTPNKDDVSKS